MQTWLLSNGEDLGGGHVRVTRTAQIIAPENDQTEMKLTHSLFTFDDVLMCHHHWPGAFPSILGTCFNYFGIRKPSKSTALPFEEAEVEGKNIIKFIYTLLGARRHLSHDLT